MESGGRLEYDLNNDDSPDVVITRRDLDNLLNAMTQLESDYKSGLAQSLHSVGIGFTGTTPIRNGALPDDTNAITLRGYRDAVELCNNGTATPNDVLSGKTFWADHKYQTGQLDKKTLITEIFQRADAMQFVGTSGMATYDAMLVYSYNCSVVNHDYSCRDTLKASLTVGGVSVDSCSDYIDKWSGGGMSMRGAVPISAGQSWNTSDNTSEVADDSAIFTKVSTTYLLIRLS